MQDSILASIGMFIQPLFTPLGFGSQLSQFAWVFAVAAITGLIAKENVIATLITLGAVVVSDPAIIELIEADEEGITAVAQMITATGITWQGCISFIAFNMLTIPCFAACATAKAELKKGTFRFTLLFWIIASFLGATFVYAFLSCFALESLAWALPVTLVLVIALVSTFITISRINKKKMAVA